MNETLTAFGHTEKISNKILIIGGGNIGFNLAKNLEESFDSARVKIIEKDKERAELIASQLNNTIVINGDALDEEVLLEANLEERSEEHTSELQSQSTISYAVFCLKKKKTTNS